MLQRIVTTLGLPPIHRVIRIEEVSTREEITRALKIRAEQGKHIIPVPAVEIKRSYPHIFFESVKILLKSKKGLEKDGGGDRGEDRRAPGVRDRKQVLPAAPLTRRPRPGSRRQPNSV